MCIDSTTNKIYDFRWKYVAMRSIPDRPLLLYSICKRYLVASMFRCAHAIWHNMSCVCVCLCCALQIFKHASNACLPHIRSEFIGSVAPIPISFTVFFGFVGPCKLRFSISVVRFDCQWFYIFAFYFRLFLMFVHDPCIIAQYTGRNFVFHANVRTLK